MTSLRCEKKERFGGLHQILNFKVNSSQINYLNNIFFFFLIYLVSLFLRQIMQCQDASLFCKGRSVLSHILDDLSMGQTWQNSMGQPAFHLLVGQSFLLPASKKQNKREKVMKASTYLAVEEYELLRVTVITLINRPPSQLLFNLSLLGAWPTFFSTQEILLL